jgi:hypothetical protein
LCSNCNRGLGLFQDNAQYLLNASKYITKRWHRYCLVLNTTSTT